MGGPVGRRSLGLRTAVLLGLLAGPRCAEPESDAGWAAGWAAGATMGTSWTVRVNAPQGWSSADTSSRVQQVLDQVEDAMSTWRPESELSRFNRWRPGPEEWFEVSSQTAEVVERALHWWRESGGAFDVTVTPLVRAWGFGPDGASLAPETEALAALRQQVGSQHLFCRLDPPALRKTLPTLEVDLSAIAKGYAVDGAARRLRDEGVQGAMVEVGGEIVCFGHRPDGEAWTIGIEMPTPGQRVLHRRLGLLDRAIATSGDYRNFVERDGVRLSHTLDPRSGRPVGHALASVSVVGPSCADADAQCTAIMVLGEQDGYAWALEQGLAARFVVRRGDAFEVILTPEFVRCFGKEE